jgi:hypothetical protein
MCWLVGRDSSANIASLYGLEDSVIESRWGAIFSAPILTGLEAHTASCMITTGYLSRRESGRAVASTTHSRLVPRLRKE